MKKVVKVVPLDDYILRLQFDDGYIGYFDCKPYLDNGVFKQLSDVELFNKVKIAFGTVEWSCGVDFDPDGLYEVCKETEGDYSLE